MKTSVILQAVLIAFCFASWPIIGKYSRTQGAWIGTLIAVGTLAMVALLSAKQLNTTALPSGRAIGLLLGASALNGLGVYFYAMKASDTRIPTGIFVVTVAVSIAMAAPLIDFLVNREALSFRRLVGLLCAIAAIYLLRDTDQGAHS